MRGAVVALLHAALRSAIMSHASGSARTYACCAARRIIYALNSILMAYCTVTGVLSAEVALLANQAVVTLDAARVPDPAILSAVEDAGFEASLVSAEEVVPISTTAAASTTPSCRVTLRVEGMTCGACTAAAEHALQSVAGVSCAEVALLPAPRAHVSYDTGATGPRAFIEALESAGFEARLAPPDRPIADGA